MSLMSLHIDSTERACRTKILTGTTTDTTLYIDNRNLWRIRIIYLRRNHLYRCYRAMTGAITAIYSIGQRYTILPDPYGMTDLDR